MSLLPVLTRRLTALAAAAVAFTAGAQTTATVHTDAHPTVRVHAAVDKTQTATLAGTHPAIVERATVGARLAASKPLSHLQLLLTSSDDQLQALRTLMDQQQDKSSPNFHKWLTPDTFGQLFGPASSDVAAVTAWLGDSGFSIESVSKSRRVITFSGSVGQVEAAFHTNMNALTVNGETHISNTTDISVPTALTPVVAGIVSLNDFVPKADAVNPHKAELPSPTQALPTGVANPMYTSTSSGAHYVTPGDVATIYNGTPLLNAGIDGTGINIAVIGRTNITLSDVQQFRSMFGLKKNDPTITVIGNDPGINGDDLEAYLDVEWAGGVAPGANVNFIVGGTNYETTGGISSSGLYAVDNNVADIITLSYGGCETSNGVTGTAFWNTLWQQAAAQGQTVFVSSGDSNATGCSSSSATYGTAYGVNALGSSAYNVAVGGTMFVDYGPSQYWSPGVSAPAPAGYNFATATGYIPEAVWNEGSLSTTYLNTASTGTLAGTGIVGGGGGLSIYTPRPAWQTGSGISATADATCSSGSCIAANSTGYTVHRMVPDLSFIAASGHDATVFCGEGSCYNTSNGYSIGAIGGTSVATPVMASVMALIDQKNGGRQGNANFYFYPLANADYTSGSGCKSINGTASNTTVTLPASTCNFHDVVAGDNRSKQNASDTTGLGFYAGSGYDAASGLGSVNIANVANNWSTVNFRATTTTFTLSPTSLTTHGASQILSASVTSPSGTPTGDISLIAETTTPGTKLRYTLTSGAYSGTISGLPGGSYNVHVHYEGDGTFAPSDSASIPVTIGKENSTLTLNLYYFTPGFVTPNPTAAIPYGSVEDLVGTVAGASGTGTPSGTLSFAITQNGSAITPYTGTLDSLGNASLIAGGTYTSLLVAPNYPALSPGTYSITVSYSGDASFNASTATKTFTIAQVTTTGTLTPSATYITSGGPETLTYTVARIGGTSIATLAPYPSGTVTFTDTTTGATLGTATLNATGVAALTTTGITASGANTISATYSGDTNYASITSTTTVTVSTSSASTTTLSVAGGTYYVGSTVTMTAVLGTATAGTLRFYDGSTYLGAVTTSTSTTNYTYTTTALTAGTHTLSASFGGSTTATASTGTTFVTINKNITTTVIESPVSSVYGGAIVLNGRVNRSPNVTNPVVALTGTVTFYDGSTAIATGTPVYLPGGYAAYTATATASILGGGTHTITATYNGDSNYASSTSANVTLTVAAATPTLTLSSTQTVYNGVTSVPLTALLPSASTLAAPTGVITFYNNGTALGTATATYNATLGGYAATYTATSQTSGTHAYTAVLAADSNYTSATSNALSVLVSTGNVWVANGNGSVSALTTSGTAYTSSALSGGGTAIAIDSTGSIWSLNKSANSVARFSNTGSVLSSGYAVGGITAPTSLAIDGAGIVWITNGDGTLSGVTSTGTAVSSTAYAVAGSTPTSINVDASGNLWITNSGDNSVTEVVGAATPVTTPITNAVTNNTLAAKP